MSLYVGQYGSLLPENYQQPMAATYSGAPPPLAQAYGNYLGEGVPSLGADDPSRQRPLSYVLPRQIELMNGFFDRSPVGSSNSSTQPVTQLVTTSTAPSTAASAQLMATPNALQVAGPYGLTYQASMTPTRCNETRGCSLNNSGGCVCPHKTVYMHQ